MNYGYIRVSTKYQNINRQIEAFNQLDSPLDKTFIDKCSGKDFKRPNYQRLVKTLKKGDHIFIKSIDRLGRNYEEIIKEWTYLTETLLVHITVLDCPLLDTSREDGTLTGRFISNLFLQVLSYVAQIERENIKQRQKEGIRIAKVKGTKFGRPKYKKPANFHAIYLRYLDGDISLRQGAQQLNVSHTTFSNWIKEYQEKVK